MERETPDSPFLLPVYFQTRGLHVGARGTGKTTAVPVSSLLPSSPQMVWLMVSSGVMVTTPCTPSSISLSQPGRVPTPSASSLHVAEGPGSPQVPCLSNKMKTIKKKKVPEPGRTFLVFTNNHALWKHLRGLLDPVPAMGPST